MSCNRCEGARSISSVLDYLVGKRQVIRDFRSYCLAKVAASTRITQIYSFCHDRSVYEMSDLHVSNCVKNTKSPLL